MAEINPYESPRCPEPPVAVAEPAEPGGGVWRQGKLLVMHKWATLPNRCVKSNQPAYGRRLKRNLYWHHPWIYLTILISLWIYIILALVLRKHALIYIGLSQQWFARRRRAILIGWGSVLAGLGMVVGGVAMVDQYSQAGVLISLGGLVFFAGAIYGLFAARMVSPQRITDDYVWLKGVDPGFLDQLPVWPYTT